MRFPVMLLFSAMALSSCGAPSDDPTNPLASGKWSRESKLMSFKISGTSVDPAEVPGGENMKAKINSTKQFCGQPRFRTKEEFQERIDESNPAGCKVESVTLGTDSANAKGSCKAMELGGSTEGSATFRAAVDIGKDEAVSNIVITSVVTSTQTGEGQHIEIEARETLKRLGDC